jgi:hypothetical protein
VSRLKFAGKPQPPRPNDRTGVIAFMASRAVDPPHEPLVIIETPAGSFTLARDELPELLRLVRRAMVRAEQLPLPQNKGKS